MLNYVVEPTILSPLVPAGTELDLWQGHAYVSLVGFLFANTRVLGLSIPWHRTFEEVNLRFYVRRQVDDHVRRAVTFVREVVPRTAIAVTARLAYNEPYRAVPMRHAFGEIRQDGIPSRIEYAWLVANRWATLAVKPIGDGRLADAGSQEAFITEHFWGYTRQRDGSTVEYQVTHPSWRVWAVELPELRGEFTELYGSTFARILGRPPASAFLADGSPVAVHRPARLDLTGTTPTRQVSSRVHR